MYVVPDVVSSNYDMYYFPYPSRLGRAMSSAVVQLRHALRSIAGFPLKGTKLTRLIFCDESGASANEAATAVAGIIVQPDTQWRQARAELENLRKEFLPDSDPGLVFHATDIFSGKLLGETWRDGQRPTRSWDLLDGILKIPAKLEIPIACAFVRRFDSLLAEHEAIFEDQGFNLVHRATIKRPSDRVLLQTYFAFLHCLAEANWYIEKQFPDEAAMVIYESHDQFNAAIRKAPAFMRNGHVASVMPPITSISSVGTAGKTEEPILQISDAIAFVVRRYIGVERVHTQRFVDTLGMSEDLTKMLEAPAGMLVTQRSVADVRSLASGLGR